MKKISSLVATVALTSIASMAYAGIAVSNLLMFITPKNTVQNLTVSNSDPNNIAYVEVTAKQLLNPGQTPAQFSTYTQGTTNPQQFGLMVSPLKFAIQAASQRDIRVVSLAGTPQSDVMYYLSISPVNPAVAPANDGSTQINMDINSSYIVKVIVLPANPLPKVSIMRSGNSITIKNSGNSYISLRNGQLCDTYGKNCAALPNGQNYNVVFAGNTWTFQTVNAGVVKFNGVYDQNKSMPIVSN